MILFFIHRLFADADLTNICPVCYLINFIRSHVINFGRQKYYAVFIEWLEIKGALKIT